MAGKRKTRQNAAKRIAGKPHLTVGGWRNSSRLIAPAVLVLVTALVFSPVLWHDFTNWDDNINLTENPLLVPPSWWGLVQFWKAPYENLYVPLFYTSYFFDLWLGGGTPRAGITHGVNLGLHCANTLLAFLLIQYLVIKLLNRHQPSAASANAFATVFAGACAGGAAIFALHPLQTETVAWATGRKDLLAGFFTLAALLVYLRFTELRKQKAPLRAQRIREFGALALYLLGLLAKPSGVVVPLALMLIEWWQRTPWREMVRRVGFWFAIAILWTLLTARTQQLTPETQAQLTSWWTRPIVASDSILFYLHKVAFPVGLSPVYGRTPIVALRTLSAWLALLTLVVATGVLYWRCAPLAFALFWFVLFLLPNSGLVPFVYQRHSTVADRYVYLSMVGIGVAVAWGLVRTWHWRRAYVWRIAGSCMIAILAALAVLTFRQERIWRTSQSLWEHTVAVSPNTAIAHANLAAIYAKQDRSEDAIRECRRAIELDPRQERAHSNLGMLLLWRGETTAALQHLHRAIEIRPTFAQPHAHLGDYHTRRGHLHDAIREYEEAIRLDPGATQAYVGLAYCYFRQKRFQQAEDAILKAIASRPHHASVWVVYGNFLADTGRPAEAAACFQRALALEPENREAREKLDALASKPLLP